MTDLKQEDFSTLTNKVETDNDLKTFIVDHVGNKLNPEDDEVNLEMVVGVMADEFPELLLCIAEENWVRGYQQALIDVDHGKKFIDEKVHKD